MTLPNLKPIIYKLFFNETPKLPVCPTKKLLVNLKEYVLDYHKAHPNVDYYLFGHVHVLSRETVCDGCEMIVLGEWIRTFSYAIMGENGLELRKWG